MCSTCENCALMLKTEEERIQWCKELTFKNISLHKRMMEQEELIEILKNKLLDKQTSLITEYAGTLLQHLNRLTHTEVTQNDPNLGRKIKEKVDEVTLLLNLVNDKRENLIKDIHDCQNDISDNITYLQGLVNYFRDSLFDELEKSNRLKQYFIKKMTHLTTDSQNVILTTLKEQGEVLNNELRLRYQKTIQKSKEEIERQGELISRLRKHNKQLYIQIQKTKNENEEKMKSLEKNLQDLKETIKRLKEKNNYLHTQIKLEVEGCQNDISDTRKRLKKILKQQ